jgi:hypothetical protein
MDSSATERRPDAGKVQHFGENAPMGLNAGGAPAHIKPTLISRIVSRRDPIESRLRRGERCIFASTISSTRSPFRDTAYASVVRSDAPIVVQHTRLDSRDPHTALLSTIAFPIA